MNNLKKRVIVGLIGIPLIIWLIIHGGLLFYIPFTLVTLIALTELYALYAAKGFRPNKSIGIIIGFFWMLCTAYYESIPAHFYILLLSIAVLATLISELIISYNKHESVPSATVAATLGGIIYVPVLMSSLFLLRNISSGTFPHVMSFFDSTTLEPGALIVLLVFVGVWTSDSFAYFGGMLFGKTPLMPHVSPKKTVEGAIIGFICSVMCMMTFSYFLMPKFPLHIMLIGCLLLAIVAPIGDLVESLLKRDAHIKDSSGILPGHGGLFDRFDSFIFAAPFFYIFLIIINAMH